MKEQIIHVQDRGFEGILYAGNDSKDKVMIVMSGSNGGMPITKKEAEFYDQNGIPALALALFATKETQPNLDRVPVEYVEKAIAWLKKEGYRQIGIDGTSKGSEMALLAASIFEDINCVVARVPSHFVSEGLIAEGKSKRPSGTSCWSWRGKDLPYAPYRSRTFDMLGMLKTEKELHIITFNGNKEITPESLIHIEKIKAPILLISSEHDSVWPSHESATYMENHLKACGYAWPVRHIVCHYMSHAAITTLPFIYRFVFKTERQHPKECKAEREQMKQALLDWVNQSWEAKRE